MAVRYNSCLEGVFSISAFDPPGRGDAVASKILLRKSTQAPSHHRHWRNPSEARRGEASKPREAEAPEASRREQKKEVARAAQARAPGAPRPGALLRARRPASATPLSRHPQLRPPPSPLLGVPASSARRGRAPPPPCTRLSDVAQSSGRAPACAPAPTPDLAAALEPAKSSPLQKAVPRQGQARPQRVREKKLLPGALGQKLDACGARKDGHQLDIQLAASPRNGKRHLHCELWSCEVLRSPAYLPDAGQVLLGDGSPDLPRQQKRLRTELPPRPDPRRFLLLLFVCLFSV